MHVILRKIFPIHYVVNYPQKMLSYKFKMLYEPDLQV